MLAVVVYVVAGLTRIGRPTTESVPVAVRRRNVWPRHGVSAWSSLVGCAVPRPLMVQSAVPSSNDPFGIATRSNHRSYDEILSSSREAIRTGFVLQPGRAQLPTTWPTRETAARPQASRSGCPRVDVARHVENERRVGIAGRLVVTADRLGDVQRQTPPLLVRVPPTPVRELRPIGCGDPG